MECYSIDDFIDLSLTSGTKWTKFNIGASNETDFGLYFQWGDVHGWTSDQVGSDNGKKYFSLIDYKYYYRGELTKYNSSDKLTILEPSDDVVTSINGTRWKIPTKKQFDELLIETNNEWTSINGVNGRKFTSKVDSSKYIFFPASGYFGNKSFNFSGSYGGYWSSSVFENNLIYAWKLYFGSGGANVGSDYRYNGNSIRGVLSQ